MSQNSFAGNAQASNSSDNSPRFFATEMKSKIEEEKDVSGR